MASKLSNIFLQETSTSLTFKPISRPGGELKLPQRNRVNHADKLKNSFIAAWNNATKLDKNKKAVSVDCKEGVYLEFISSPDHDLISKSLEDVRQGVRLLNIRKENINDEVITKAMVFVPKDKQQHFLKKINEYAQENTKNNNWKHKDLINSIDDIRNAIVESFWIGEKSYIPSNTKVWCEVWLRIDVENYEQEIKGYYKVCDFLEIPYKEQMLIFPERVVTIAYVSFEDLNDMITSISVIAEIRKANELANFYTTLERPEQYEWIEEASHRIKYNNTQQTKICIIDTGVNSNHMLLNNSISQNEMFSINPNWNSEDKEGHGTEMAGIATYFNLEDFLSSDDNLIMNHSLESVKILNSRQPNDPDLYGYITTQAVSLVEIENPNVNRVICMAITSENSKEFDGRPASWSGAIDALVAGANDGIKRLFLISTGNTKVDEIKSLCFPDANLLHTVENPAQAWNAISVGAFTEKTNIEDSSYAGYLPVAELGDLSPFTATSFNWNKKWPIKPEIVCEGGNIAVDDADFYTKCEDLSLLTTTHQSARRPLTTFDGTSLATAQASWLAAQIYNAYPTIWPETVRAIMIHSAEWTNTMKRKYLKSESKGDYRKLLRLCGYGVPNLEKALWCANNNVNMVIEDTIQPYVKVKNTYKINEMHLHELPWPKDVLRNLGGINVIVKITLSYFIEPSPGEIGWKDKYRYPSSGLRFDLNNIGEDEHNFIKRINIAMREDEKEDKGEVANDSSRWILGSNNRDVGSIHSDSWQGSAINLCECNYIAIYPVGGWWKDRTHLKKYNNNMRYSLVVSLSTPELDVDLYTPIITQVKSKVPIKINVTSV